MTGRLHSRWMGNILLIAYRLATKCTRFASRPTCLRLLNSRPVALSSKSPITTDACHPVTIHRSGSHPLYHTASMSLASLSPSTSHPAPLPSLLKTLRFKPICCLSLDRDVTRPKKKKRLKIVCPSFKSDFSP